MAGSHARDLERHVGEKVWRKAVCVTGTGRERGVRRREGDGQTDICVSAALNRDREDGAEFQTSPSAS